MSKKQKFEDALNHVCTVVKTDGNWKYANAGKATLDAERKNKRAFNCAHGVNYALKIAGILPKGGLFYIDGKANVKYNGTAAEKKAISEAIKKHFDIIRVNNYLGKVGAKHLDIIGFYGTPHTMDYDSGTKTWDFGSRAGKNPKLKCHKSNSYGSKVGIILRLKEDKTPEKFPTYNLTDAQIRGIANICANEQGGDNEAGMRAEASLIANRTDIKGNEYATVENIVKTVTSGWFAHGKSRFAEGTTNKKAIKAVTDVIVNGKRTLPRYIDEHDCLPDITRVENGVKSDKSTWKRHETVIYNRMTSVYKFYDFPGGYKTGVDPFGYTSDTMRKKWGEFCYTLEESMSEKVEKKPYSGKFPTLPTGRRKWYQVGDTGTNIKYIQQLLNWAVETELKKAKIYPLIVDGKYGSKTEFAVKHLQKKAGTKQNGKFGKNCLAYCKKLKK